MGVLGQLLTNTKFPFYLKGSRFIGGHRPDSDFDFVAKYSNEIEAYLIELGFEYHCDQAHYDAGMSGMENGWTTTMLSYNRDGAKIEVTLSPRPEIFIAASEIVRDHFFEWHLNMPKKDRWEIWETLLGLLNRQARERDNNKAKP